MSNGVAPSSSATSLTHSGDNEMKHRERIDEAADQPRTGDAIDLGPLARHPHARLVTRDVHARCFARHQRPADGREGFDPAIEDRDVDPVCREQRRRERADIVAVHAIDDQGRATGSDATSHRSPDGRARPRRLCVSGTTGTPVRGACRRRVGNRQYRSGRSIVREIFFAACQPPQSIAKAELGPKPQTGSPPMPPISLMLSPFVARINAGCAIAGCRFHPRA